jgi:hypothetical protein
VRWVCMASAVTITPARSTVSSNGWKEVMYGRPRGEVPAYERVLFRVVSPRTRRASFPAPGSPVVTA